MQDFNSSVEFYIENESKVEENNIEVRNRTILNQIGYELKVHRIEKFWIDYNWLTWYDMRYS